MKELLMKYGFTPNKDNTIWEKNEWTIKLEDKKVEAYNETLYAYVDADQLQDILDDISATELI